MMDRRSYECCSILRREREGDGGGGELEMTDRMGEGSGDGGGVGGVTVYLTGMEVNGFL